MLAGIRTAWPSSTQSTIHRHSSRPVVSQRWASGPRRSSGWPPPRRAELTIALVGDGAFGANPSVVPTAVEMGVAPIWVVMNNAAFGTIAGLELKHYGTSYGTEFRANGEPYSPDYAAWAAACGADGVRIQRAAELLPGTPGQRWGAGVPPSSTCRCGIRQFPPRGYGTSNAFTTRRIWNDSEISVRRRCPTGSWHAPGLEPHTVERAAFRCTGTPIMTQIHAGRAAGSAAEPQEWRSASRARTRNTSTSVAWP